MKFYGVRLRTSVHGEAVIIIGYPVTSGDTSYIMRCGDRQSALDWVEFTARRYLAIPDDRTSGQA